jgi:site-specific recombinase XerD
MKVTEFASVLNRYFNDYLVNDRGSSPRTIETYRSAFIQLVEYLEEQKGIRPERVQINDISRENIMSFLLWLENSRKVSPATRNQRLAALRCFATFLKYERPEYIEAATQIQGIKLKKSLKKDISYLKPEGMRLLFSQIDKTTISGRRDYTMAYIMYTTGVRVSELISIRGCDISLSNPKTIIIHGKGRKVRHVPIVKQVAPILERYLKENKCLFPQRLDEYIFLNHSGDMFTRQGVNYIISKYAQMARTVDPSIVPQDCSPHKIRHSSAMALVEEGVDLIIIRDLLGHSSVQTTEIYAKVSSAKRRRAIEATSKEVVPEENALWENSTSIKDWLKGLSAHKVM